MTPAGLLAYNAMRRISDEIGLPKTFRTDLSTHDRAFCERLSLTQLFVWAPYETGTHILKPERGSKFGEIEKIVETLEEMGGRFYFWGGLDMRELSADQIREGALEEAARRALDVAIDNERPDLSGYDERDTYEPSGAEYL